MYRPQRGFSLLEVLVALGIGVVLIAAFLAVLQRSRSMFVTGESLSQVQDAARHALGVLVFDLQHAGFFGLQPADKVQLVSALPAGAQDCGSNFAVNLALPVEASDNRFRLGEDARDCRPTASADGASDTADTLTIRRASIEVAEPRTGRLQVYSHALASMQPLLLFADGRAPAPRDEGHEIRDLEVRSYYIANSSVNHPGWPALRVKALTESRGAAQFRDEEIMPGVEDLQVELGLEVENDGMRGIEFVTPDSPRARRERVVAVRLWLRLRADDTEGGYRDDRALHYSNTRFEPEGAEVRRRRIIVTRTIALRNT